MPSFADVVQKGGKYEPEKDRYVLYIGHFCPFAQRAAIMRKLKGLDEILPIVVVNTVMDPSRRSWTFLHRSLPDRPEVGVEGTVPEPLYGLTHIAQLYEMADKGVKQGPYPVPVLWDKKTKTIVNNESADLMRWLNHAFNDLLPADKAALNFCPPDLESEIDEFASWVQPDVIAGAYECGFALDQASYEAAIPKLFDSLDRLEGMLSTTQKEGKGLYVFGERLTEADIRLYTSLVRFDVAYAGVFKTNKKMIRHDYPALHKWLQNLYWNHEAFKSTTFFDHIKSNYWAGSSKANQVNPTRVVPLGPLPHILPFDA